MTDRFDLICSALQRCLPGGILLREEPLAKHTSFHIGGPCRIFAQPASAEELAAAMAFLRGESVPFALLGNGTNVLCADEGFDGVIVHTGLLQQLCVTGTQITAECGVLLSKLANTAAASGLTGLEFAHGIPGSVGGAISMNAGAYGGEMVQVTDSVTYLTTDGEIRTVPGADCDFSYRHSRFQNGETVLSAVFRLTEGDEKAIRDTMADLNRRRREKQPLELPSAGSAFKRPVGGYAAAMIDQCGLRGYRVGNAAVSEKHTGFIVNLGGATCADVLAVMDAVREKVSAQCGVLLEPEIRRI